MADQITIDAAGRLVIPKALRERLKLGPGARLHVFETEGRLVLTPDRPEPRLVERDGFLVIDFGTQVPLEADETAAREERLKQLVDYALRR